jgi:hypothetical protein
MSDAPLREIVHGDLTLAQFAELSALARSSSPPFQDSLAARGMSEEDWSAARTAWNRAIEAEIERGDDGLVVAFAEALAEAKERLRREPPETGSRRESVLPKGPPAPFPLASASRASPPELLSITEAPPNPAFVPASAHVAPPAPVTAPAPAAASGHVPQLPRVEAESPRLDVTAKLPLQEIIARILPFQPASSSPAPAPQSPASPVASAAPIPRLTPEQYASLTAELAVRPHRADEVRARYFVANKPAWDALQSEWRQRMNADPRLKQRIDELVLHYRSWLESAGGGPKDR